MPARGERGQIVDPASTAAMREERSQIVDLTSTAAMSPYFFASTAFCNWDLLIFDRPSMPFCLASL